MGARFAIACAVLAACGEEPLAPTELPACGQFREGHWDQRLVAPGASGVGARVGMIVRMPDGSVIAGGTFNAMSGVGARNVARWNGTTWSALGEGLPGQVNSLVVDDDGQLWASGMETGGKGGGKDGPFGGGSYLARWTGTDWSYALRDVFSINGLTAVDGGIAVFGTFFGLPTVASANGLALLRDGVWSSTSARPGSTIISATRSDNGVCVGGDIQMSTTVVSGVACWNGVTWTSLGSALSEWPLTIAQHDGTWYIGGSFELFDGANSRYGIARLEGDNQWHPLDGGVFPREATTLDPPGTARVSSISFDGDALVIAGSFEWVGVPKMRTYNLARWNPSGGWSAMTSTDLFGQLSAVMTTGDHTYVGGTFTRIGVQPGAGIATFDAGTARSLPEATLAPARLGQITDLVGQADGVVVAGRFQDAIGEEASTAHALLQFDGEWHAIDDVPAGDSVSGVALGDGSYAIRSGESLFRRLPGRPWQQLCCGTDSRSQVLGPLAADGNGTLFFVLRSITDTSVLTRIVRSTPDDTSFYANVTDDVVAMAVYDGELVIITRSSTLGGELAYRLRDEQWQLIGAWSDFTSSLVASPALGLVAAAQGGTRVWNGTEWRHVSTVSTLDMAACSDGVIAAIDDPEGSRLAFLDDLDGDWTFFGTPRAAPWWQLLPTERGIYVANGFPGSSDEAPLGFARWTTLDDSGW